MFVYAYIEQFLLRQTDSLQPSTKRPLFDRSKRQSKLLKNGV